MKLRSCLVALVICGCAIAVAGVRKARSSQTSDPVALSPQLYKVRLENSYVRVLEYRSPPGQKEPLHSHPPGIVYSLSDYTIRITDADGRARESNGKTGEVEWRDHTTHASENVGKTDVHVLAIELKMPLGKSAQ
jgi:hypothetical protein